jgi:hypothetical protein
MWMKKILNERNQIHNFMSSSGSGSVINYGSGSDFLTSYSSGSGSGPKSQKVTVPTVPVPVPVPQHCIKYLWCEAAGRCPPFSWLRVAWRETCRIRVRHWSQAFPAPNRKQSIRAGHLSTSSPATQRNSQSQLRIDHKLLERRTESSQSKRCINHKLLLRHRETANHSDALITNFLSAAQKAIRARHWTWASPATNRKQPIRAWHWSQGSLRQTESSQSDRVNYLTRNRNEMCKVSNTVADWPKIFDT